MAKYDIAAVRTIIGENLGRGGVDIELKAEHYNRGIDAACKALARFFPKFGYATRAVDVDGNKTRLDIPNLIGVVNCEFFTSGSRLEEAPYYTRYVDRAMELADMKDTQKVFGDDPEWHFMFEPDPATGQPVAYLYTHFTRSSFVDTFARIPNIVSIEFTWAIEASDEKLTGIQHVPLDLRQWVEDYATARCRLILADIRNKFGGEPGADDGAILPNDGGQQTQRAEAMIAKLEKDLQLRARQAPLVRF